eukprot:gene35031-47070_t
MSDDPGEVIIEAIRNGTYLKVTAVHVATGREATAVGPAHEPRQAASRFVSPDLPVTAPFIHD